MRKLTAGLFMSLVGVVESEPLAIRNALLTYGLRTD